MIFSLVLSSCFKTAEQIASEKSVTHTDDSKYIENADVQSELDNTKIQLQKMQGLVQDSNAQIETLKKENEELKARFAKLEQDNLEFREKTTKHLADIIGDVAILDERTSSPSPKSKSDATKADKPKKKIDPNLSPLDQAKNLLNQKKHKEAEQVLEKALEGKSQYRDQILFEHGRALYLQKDYKRAIVSFDEVVQKHPKSNKWKRSVELVADSFENLNLKTEASAYRSLLNKK